MLDEGTTEDGAELARLRAHLEAAQRLAGLASWELDLADGTVRPSANLGAVLGWAPEGAGCWDDVLACVRGADRARVARAHDDAVSAGHGYDVEHRTVDPEGVVRRVRQQVVVEHRHDGPARMIGTVRDVTEQAARTRRLVEVEARRREVLHRLVRASEQARTHLATDLHDGPVQVLTATAMRLEVLARTDPEPPGWLLGALPVVRAVSSQLRDVLFDLHPQVTGTGAVDAIEHLAATVLPGTPVTVRLHGQEPPAPTVRAVHGLLQEALWDIREHDTAGALTIGLTPGDPTEVVISSDDGEGPLLTRGGLLGVRERAEAAGGTATVDGDGRTVRCALHPDGPTPGGTT